MDNAASLLSAFIQPERRERYLALLTSNRGRRKLREKLAHLRDLDARFAHRIPPAAQSSAEIGRLLKSRGAPDMCYVVSENAEIDDHELALDEALEIVVGRGLGTLLSCLPGRLAYFEGEEAGERFLLERAV